jgi:tetratricopeptide (TPR) repeat protein
MLVGLGRGGEADALMDRFSTIAQAFAARQPLVPAWWNLLMAWRQAYAKEEPYRALDHADKARSLAEMFNDGRIILTAQVFRAMNLWFLGALEPASQALREARGADAALGAASSVRRFCLTWTLGDLGALDQAYLVAHELIAVAQSQQLALDEGRGRWALAEVLRRAGDLDRADQEIHVALSLLSAASPLDCPGVLSTLAALHLAQGRAGEALAAAEEALARYEEMGVCGFFRGAFLRLVHAEALAAAGEEERARAAIGVARERLLANAAKIDEPGYQKSFLEAVPENARTLALAAAWLGEGGRP